MTTLKDFLENPSNYTELYLSGICLSSEDIEKIAKALEGNNTVTNLDFSNCNIKCIGAVTLGKMLENNDTITVLNLSENQIGNVGAVALAKMFESNTTLSYFFLSNNRIGDDAAVVFARAIESSNSLSWLDLDGNMISDVGAEAIVKVLESGRGILLNISDNGISDTIISRWRENHLSYKQRPDVLEEIVPKEIELKLSEGEEPSFISRIKAENGKVFNARKECMDMYAQMAESYYEQGLYKKAIMCYMVLSKDLDINQCFEVWLAQEPENLDVMMMQGDYLTSIGQNSEAMTHYLYVIDQGDESVRKKASAKIANILNNNKVSLADHSQTSSNGDPLHLEIVTEEFLSELAGDANGYEFA